MGLESLNSVTSNMTALSKQYQAISHNLANSNTAGFKKSVSKFENILSNAAVETKDLSVSNNLKIDFSQGSLNATGRNFDFAISGNGFFQINTPRGPVYSRSGNFRTNRNGNLVDSLGRIIASDAGPITVPNNVSMREIKVAEDGTVYAKNQALGKLRLVEFTNMENLKPVGAGCFSAGQNAGQKPAENSKVLQGYSEQSNVNAVEELVNLIKVNRLYQANAKSITLHDEKAKSLLRVANS